MSLIIIIQHCLPSAVVVDGPPVPAVVVALPVPVPLPRPPLQLPLPLSLHALFLRDQILQFAALNLNSN